MLRQLSRDGDYQPASNTTSSIGARRTNAPSLRTGSSRVKTSRPRCGTNNVWYDEIRPSLQPLGLDWVNYQTLRRTAVTLMNATGADGTIVAAQCGNTVDVSTNVYNKVGLERQPAVQNLDNALTQTPQTDR